MALRAANISAYLSTHATTTGKERSSASALLHTKSSSTNLMQQLSGGSGLTGNTTPFRSSAADLEDSMLITCFDWSATTGILSGRRVCEEGIWVCEERRKEWWSDGVGLGVGEKVDECDVERSA